MIQILHNATDISARVLSLSPMLYRRNDSGTYELPEISLETTISTAAVGDTVTVKDGVSQSITFFIDRIVYDHQSGLYQWECPHILSLLKGYYARDINLSWSGITSPDYAQYNYQTGIAQGQNRWERRYWQVLFLVQTLIAKATGVPVSSINILKVAGNSPFYRRTQNEFSQWVTTYFDYTELGVSLESLRRIGSKTHLDYISDEYDVYGSLPTALDVLNWLCAACGLYIDIFRSDYSISLYAEQPAPSESVQIAREDRALDRYRFYSVTATRLVAGSLDFQYGTWDVYDDLIPYTYGTADAEYELTKQHLMIENAGVSSRKSLNVVFPALFKLYAINDRGDYRSNISYIINAENGDDWLKMWLDYHTDYWLDRSMSRLYTVPLGVLSGGGRSVEIDVSLQAQTKKYEVLT